jgi:hypothetical protein
VPAAVKVTGGKSTPAAVPVMGVAVAVNRDAPFMDVLIQSVVHGTIPWGMPASSFVQMIVSPTCALMTCPFPPFSVLAVAAKSNLYFFAPVAPPELELLDPPPLLLLLPLEGGGLLLEHAVRKTVVVPRIIIAIARNFIGFLVVLSGKVFLLLLCCAGLAAAAQSSTRRGVMARFVSNKEGGIVRDSSAETTSSA